MSVAPILGLRRAIVSHLRADVAVTSTSVGQRIYGERTPATLTWPFARYGVSDASGEDIIVPVHIFSKDAFTDDVNAIAEAIAGSLDERTLALGDDRRAYIAWETSRLVASDEHEWHSIVTFSARIPKDCA
jgi:hypothetical protein